MMKVDVRNNNVDQALRILKKKMQREGLLRDMKGHRFYEKPSEKRKAAKAMAVKRHFKLATKLEKAEAKAAGVSVNEYRRRVREMGPR